ncbi:MAG: hypothetical protein IJY04_07170 [Clostridia bacterium]|nr:hypothetical protein [Clostridia bacterium]
MKRIFAYNAKDESENVFSEENFKVCDYEDEAYFDELDRLDEEYENQRKNSAPSHISMLIPSIIAIALMIIEYKVVIPIIEASEMNPVIVGIMLLLNIGVIFFILNEIRKRRKNEGKKTSEEERAEAEYKKAKRRLMTKVGVPEDATEIDILEYSYFINKKGVEKITSCGILGACIYVEDGRLYASDGDTLYAFSLDSFRDMKYFSESISVFGWEKTDSIDSAEYAEYGIKEIADGYFSEPGYWRVTLEHDEEEVELRIACYEGLHFSRLVGLAPRS